MQKITPCLWFDKEGEEAARLYVSIFKNSTILSVVPAGAGSLVRFQLDGQDFMALSAGPVFKFTPAISLVVSCETQEELDEIWNKLSADKASEQCGWLKDKYGLSWQIVPTVLSKLMQDKDPKKSERVMNALLKMKKLDIKALQEAYESPANT